MERVRGFEPPTCSVETNCSESVELHPRIIGGKQRTRTSMRVAARQFSGLLPDRFGLPSYLVKTICVSGWLKSKIVRCEVKEITFFFVRPGNIWQARSDLNWKLRFWRPAFCRLKLRAFKNSRFQISDSRFNLEFGFWNLELNIGVSDGIWTRSIRFGRPLLSHLSFAHKIWNLKWCIGKDLNFQSC